MRLISRAAFLIGSKDEGQKKITVLIIGIRVADAP